MAIRVLGPPYFLLLPSRWLVFVAAQGGDYRTSRNYLVVVDLSRGLLKPTARTVDIPTSSFTKPGRNAKMIRIDRMEKAGDQSIRIFVPESEYGASSEVVNLGDHQ
jgi:hypothetical protein